MTAVKSVIKTPKQTTLRRNVYNLFTITSFAQSNNQFHRFRPDIVLSLFQNRKHGQMLSFSITSM